MRTFLEREKDRPAGTTIAIRRVISATAQRLLNIIAGCGDLKGGLLGGGDVSTGF